MKLTKNFSLEEFTVSTSGQKAGIDNTPNQIQIKRIQELCEDVLQPLRTAYGRPITITSGFRCPALNKLVGGVEHSEHQDGTAVDIWADDLPYLFGWIQEHCEYNQLIWEYGRWIHISYSRNKKQVLFKK